ncbi:complement component 1 Q subcomponent-binding protein, mitochondrial [Culicoides brevitarsis]|uniref:complement component 1 Q subcomponent-binding protein, mitochondrial n=1 Tax=Culicoides brevitarsis TaxID=469753 RepID=UPI00307BD6B4
MFRVVRSAFNTGARLSTSFTRTSAITKREFTRNFIAMCNQKSSAATFGNHHKHGMTCACGCGIRGVHTKGERELVEFLAEEIGAEKKAQKSKTIPAEVDGFKVKLDGAEVEMTKMLDNEKVVIKFNINHSVDTEAEPEIDPNADKPDFGEMKSKPTFEVDIVRGNTTLGFTCSFFTGEAEEGEYNDVFSIDELTLYEGEHSEKTYAVSGDVLDGYLYDLLMNFLEEKGVSNDFVEKMCDFSTQYEHAAYISLLEGLSKFTARK